MASNPNYCDITPEIEALAAQSLQNMNGFKQIAEYTVG